MLYINGIHFSMEFHSKVKYSWRKLLSHLDVLMKGAFGTTLCDTIKKTATWNVRIIEMRLSPKAMLRAETSSRPILEYMIQVKQDVRKLTGMQRTWRKIVANGEPQQSDLSVICKYQYKLIYIH